MDFTFLMLVFSSGFLIGSYFFYWHIENVITAKNDRIMDDIETLFSGWRSALREDLDIIKESLEKLKIDYGKVRETVLEEIKKQNNITYKPARKTSMKLQQKTSLGGHDD